MRNLLVILFTLLLILPAEGVSIYRIVTYTCKPSQEKCEFYCMGCETPHPTWFKGSGTNKGNMSTRYFVTVAYIDGFRFIVNKTPVPLILGDNAYSGKDLFPSNLFVFWVNLYNGQIYDISWNPISPERVEPVLTNWRKTIASVKEGRYYLPPAPQPGYYMLVVGTNHPRANDSLGKDWLNREWDGVTFQSVYFSPDFDENWPYFKKALRRVHSLEDLCNEVKLAWENFPSRFVKVVKKCRKICKNSGSSKQCFDRCRRNNCDYDCLLTVTPGKETWENPEVGVSPASLLAFLEEIILYKKQDLNVPADHLWFLSGTAREGDINITRSFLLIWKEDEDMFYACETNANNPQLIKGHTLGDIAAEVAKQHGSFAHALYSVHVPIYWWEALVSKDFYCASRLEYINDEAHVVRDLRNQYILPFSLTDMMNITGEQLMHLTGRR